ncbi:DNA repair ATPase SMC5 [Ascoidea rubescens DSM 1968]|uniref:Structural maintenance of chromosomes protein 5 n=1 Tax=Ascoidea rubescens DSM 1968 TaxID=1344418 RepID=A0A1D2VPH9_9ASCO|nr:P-loop containing nucleoside triphosphate hydrolase protein [Ascoidea rubescens DSM 1968]ODV63523.1 P-loop containing nucleoside triphosphate hydrolase protein [Ascoidea rubescens DSM 1968]
MNTQVIDFADFVPNDFVTDSSTSNANNKRARSQPSISASKKLKSNDVSIVSDRNLDLEKFKTGNIVKIKLTNFITFSNAEFNLSPHLNMIIGPNGTGKSTFVSAVCLGLAGKPDLLGRQKKISEFIKIGNPSAIIEIFLCNHNDNNKKIGFRPLIKVKRIININEKSQWYLDDAQVNETTIRKKISSLNIQLNNLCSFLPQDKIVEFAKLKPEELLLETERCLNNGSLEVIHKNLIDLDFHFNKINQILSEKKSDYQKLIDQRKLYQSEAEKFKKYNLKIDELRLHLKLLPYAIIQDLRKNAKIYKIRKDNLALKLKEFMDFESPFDDKIASLNLIVDKYNNKLHDIDVKKKQILHNLKSFTEEINKFDKFISKCNTNIINLKSKSERKKIELKELLSEISLINEEKNQVDLPTQLQFDDCKAKKDQFYQLSNNLKRDLLELNDSITIKTNIKNRIISATNNLNSQLNSKDRIGVLNISNSEAFTNCKKAVLYYRANLNRFKGFIFEPPILSMNVTDQRYSIYLQEVIDSYTQIAMTAKDQQTYNKLSFEFYDDQKINVPFKYLSNSSITRNYTTEQLGSFGFDGYAVDFINGPDEVVQMLCEQSFLNDIPISLRNLSTKQLEFLKKKDQNGRIRFRKFIAGDYLYALRISRYGSRQVIYTTNRINRKRNSLFDSSGITQEQRSTITENINDNKRKVLELGQQIANIKENLKIKGSEYDNFNSNFEAYKSKLNEYSNQKKIHISLEEKTKKFQKKVEELREIAEKDFTPKIIEIENFGKKYKKMKLKKINEMAKFVFKINELNFLKLKINMKIIEQTNKKLTIENLMEDFQKTKRKLENQLEIAKKEYAKAKNIDYIRKIKEQTNTYTDEEKSKLGELAEKYQKEENMTEVKIQNIIKGIESEISMLGDASSSSIEKLRKVENDIKILSKEIPGLEKEHKKLCDRIKNLRDDWEPKLDELIQHISRKFAKGFRSVGSAGEICINKKANFKDWRLEILVKFRDNSDLRVLDAFVQSGGERAVSTIFYIISLQGLTSSPFRIVDEINQGMDPRNERIVHEHLVNVACNEENNASTQYFLITPKLLKSLHYHKNMSIHCIMANHNMPLEIN